MTKDSEETRRMNRITEVNKKTLYAIEPKITFGQIERKPKDSHGAEEMGNAMHVNDIL